MIFGNPGAGKESLVVCDRAGTGGNPSPEGQVHHRRDAGTGPVAGPKRGLATQQRRSNRLPSTTASSSMKWAMYSKAERRLEGTLQAAGGTL